MRWVLPPLTYLFVWSGIHLLGGPSWAAWSIGFVAFIDSMRLFDEH
jgi:energy-converting hydrogenase Eha subunit G